MRIQQRIYLVGSGDSGIGISHPLDCTVYLLDGGMQQALIDTGAGVDCGPILQNIRQDGFPADRINRILLTHGHGDHAGGAARLARECGASVYAMREAAQYVSRGDKKALSLDSAVKAGVYPPEYQFEPCPVLPLEDGQSFLVGDLTVTAILTEGHCAGHACFLVQLGQQTALFSGDSVFYGGKISLQNIWDCDLQKYLYTCRRLALLRPDILLPSHGAFSLNRGYLHLERAMRSIDLLGVPINNN